MQVMKDWKNQVLRRDHNGDWGWLMTLTDTEELDQHATKEDRRWDYSETSNAAGDQRD
jgi:hypothetical protein